MAIGPDDIPIGINVTANSDAAALLTALKDKIIQLRTEAERGTGVDIAREQSISVNQAIVAWDHFGQQIDATNLKAVKAFGQQGEAITQYLVKLGATDRELGKIFAAINTLEQRSAKATILPNSNGVDDAARKLVRFGNAADATFERVPRGARTAAAAFTTLAFTFDGANTSATGLVRAAGGLAFGLSQLSSNANIVAGASGIGALVIVAATVIELFRRGTEETQKQTAALKSFNETNDAFVAKARAAKDVVTFLQTLPGNTASAATVAAISKQVEGLDEAIKKAKADLATPNTSHLVAPSDVVGLADASARSIELSEKVNDLRKRLSDGGVTFAQFTAQLKAFAKTNADQDLAEFIVQVEQEAAAFDRLKRARAEESAAAQQAAAIEQQTRDTFGFTPELAKALDEVNRQYIALHRGGVVALQHAQDEQKALKQASDAWEQYIKFVGDATIADVTFEQARTRTGTAFNALSKKQQDQLAEKAESILTTTRNVIRTGEVVAGGAALADLARREADKAAELIVARQKGTFAAQRKAADDEFEQRKTEIGRMKGLEADKNTALAAIDRQHTENIIRIDREEANKVRDLLAQLSEQRIAAEAKLDDDEFAVRRSAAKKLFDADIKRIDEAKLNDAADKAARLDAERAFNANIAEVEKERGKRIEDIRVQVQAHIDELTGRTGEVDAAKIRETYDKQLDVLTAAINSTSTTEVVKAAARVGVELIEKTIPLDIAKARMGELLKTLSGVETSSQAEVTRATALVTAHAITERQAREAIVGALTRERDAVARILPLLEEQAANLPGNEDAQAKVDQYRTKLVQLGLQIGQIGDQFFKLKTTARDATTDALAAFFEGATKLGTQDHAEINSLKNEITSAQQELNSLLATPSGLRTSEQNNRITELRQQIQQTSVQLDSAQRSIRGWRDLFLEAAQAIVDALVRVSSQMLATAIIERALGFFGGLASGHNDPLSGNAGVGDLPGGAPGQLHAYWGGPVVGAAGIDKVRGNLTAGEFVQPVPTVDYYTPEFMEALRTRMISREAALALLDAGRPTPLRNRSSFYNVGGLVDPGVSRTEFRHRFEIVAPPGFEVRNLDSPAGHEVVLSVIQQRQRAVAAIVGPHIGR